MIVLPATNRDLRFPPAELATPEGLLAIGGDLSPDRLLTAYRQGVFPWYSTGQPILWWSPNPRTVLFLDRLKVSRSLRKTLRSRRFQVTMDTCFGAVMEHCAMPRRNQSQPGTWITPEMLRAYIRLHELGYAHSIETWHGDDLVGGLYGVALGAAFFGESMFSLRTDASKVALVHLVGQLRRWNFAIVDCQMPSTHLFSLGAEEIDRREFLARLDNALRTPTRRGPWRLEPDLEVE
jgi:leucyl/phenylalanyl-tRNA--protein transferase